jgi:hypothetical protein
MVALLLLRAHVEEDRERVRRTGHFSRFLCTLFAAVSGQELMIEYLNSGEWPA